jgi:hypothetical protein
MFLRFIKKGKSEIVNNFEGAPKIALVIECGAPLACSYMMPAILEKRMHV